VAKMIRSWLYYHPCRRIDSYIYLWYRCYLDYNYFHSLHFPYFV